MSVVIFIIVYIIITKICIGLLIMGLYQKNTSRICISKRRLDGKTVIVSGGTNGMGLEISKDFARRGARVIVACPFEEEGHNAQKLIVQRTGNENVIFENLDLSSFNSIRKFAARFIAVEDRLDILVNNAGINKGTQLTKDGYNRVMQVNYFGTVLLTLLLLPLLNRSGTPDEPSRIVNTISLFNKRGNADDDDWSTPELSNWVSYRNSKLCVALFTRELARRLQHRNVIVNMVEPGVVGTSILQIYAIFGSLITYLARAFFKTPWEGAQTAIYLSVSEDLQDSGKCFYNCKIAMDKLSPLYYDDKLCKSLWEKTMKAVKFEDSVVLVS